MSVIFVDRPRWVQVLIAIAAIGLIPIIWMIGGWLFDCTYLPPGLRIVAGFMLLGFGTPWLLAVPIAVWLDWSLGYKPGDKRDPPPFLINHD